MIAVPSLLALLLAASPPNTHDDAPEIPVGVSRVDVTPDGPIRLTGYGNRSAESEGVAQRLWAKALAIGGDEGDGPAVLITVDNLGIPDPVTSEVARRLADRAGLPRDRLAICASHTHTAPMLTGVAPFLFPESPTDDERQRVDRYTQMLTDRLTEAALDALSNRRPAQLDRGIGSASFAANRRVLQDGKWIGFGVNPDGPTDHSLPVLRATDPDGSTLAVLASYACHCTTLSGEFNEICGDWAGFAQEAIEREIPGAIALVAIGCGADANPEPRGELSQARDHGEALARAVSAALAGPMTPVGSVSHAELRRIDLPFAPLPSRGHWREKAELATQEGLHARAMLERLERGEALPESLADYPVQVWAFGDDLAMVFLAGEVVVDYAILIRGFAEPDRLWINGYSNDAPCYIPSDRLLDEGGYETDGSMIFYGRPTRFAHGAEGRILDAVRELLPPSFLIAPGSDSR